VEIFKRWAYEKKLSPAEALAQVCRIPISGMGRTRQQKLYRFVRQLVMLQKEMADQSIADTLDYVIKKASFQELYKDDSTFKRGCSHLSSMAEAWKNDAAGFFVTIALSKDTDTYDHRVEKVALITMHAAKGLEFPVVFISGCEDGWIPYISKGRPVDLEEERRLFYVAMTRAKQHLLLTKADARRVHGRKQRRRLSPFVEDIENRLKTFSGQTGKKRDKQEQRSLF
jgi:superfamily I DNA/RNA helicase